jgi:hypothetical protein
VKAESRSNQEKPGRKGRDLIAGKELLNLASVQVPSNAHPIIQSLQRQLDVRGSFQFQHGEPAVSRQGKKVDNVPIACRKGKHLSVQRFGQQDWIDRSDI